MHPGDSVGRLSRWLAAQMRAQGLDAGTDPVLERRITMAAAAAVERYRADPSRNIDLSLVANINGQPVERPIRITPAAMRQILGEQLPPPPPRQPSSRPAQTRVDPPTAVLAPVPPSPPSPPAYQPAGKASATNRNGLWLVLGILASVGVAAITATAVVMFAGAGSSDDDDEQAGGGTATTVPAATATPTQTPTTAPASTPSPTRTPTPRPTPTPEMHPGREVRVVNTAPDPCLYLRPAPDRTTTPLTCLLVDTQLRLLRGPDDLDGIRWWYVEVPDYQDQRWEGYAAEKELTSGTTWLVPD